MLLAFERNAARRTLASRERPQIVEEEPRAPCSKAAGSASTSAAVASGTGT
jgi:hypothetical protein